MCFRGGWTYRKFGRGVADAVTKGGDFDAGWLTLFSRGESHLLFLHSNTHSRAHCMLVLSFFRLLWWTENPFLSFE